MKVPGYTLHRHLTKLSFWRALGVLLSTSIAWGQHADSRPDPEGTPTVVHVRAIVFDVSAIDSARQSFEANLFIRARWRDERLAHSGTSPLRRPLEDVWHPGLQVVNLQRVWQTMPQAVDISPDGEVTYRQRMAGTFSQPMHVGDFPLDTQRLRFTILPSAHAGQEVSLVPDERDRSFIAEKFSAAAWDPRSWSIEPIVFGIAAGEESRPAVELAIDFNRRVGSYVLKIYVPLVLIVIMAWSAFWIDPMETGPPIGVATTSMLTLIAYRFMVGQELPAVSYLTRMDLFILSATLLVFLTLIETVVAHRLVRNERVEAARRIDWHCRWIFATAVVGICVVPFVI